MTPAAFIARTSATQRLDRRPAIARALDGIERDVVHDRAAAGEPRRELASFLLQSRSPFQERPLHEERIRRAVGVGERGIQEHVGRDARARGRRSSRSCGSSVCSESARPGRTSRASSCSKTRGSPTVEKTMFLCGRRPSVPSAVAASSTASKLCAGSPMPMNTTRRTLRSRRDRATSARISRDVTCARSPCSPVLQKRQPTAQPTCVDTQRPSRGRSTLSRVCREARRRSLRQRAVGRGMALDLHDERVEASRERGQRREERVREAAGTRARRIVEREAAQPAREDRGHVERARADVAQVLAQLGDGSQERSMAQGYSASAVGRLLGATPGGLAARRGRATLRHSEAPGEDRAHRHPRRRQDHALLRPCRAAQAARPRRASRHRGGARMPAPDQPRHDARRAELDPAHAVRTRDRRRRVGRRGGVRPLGPGQLRVLVHAPGPRPELDEWVRELVRDLRRPLQGAALAEAPLRRHARHGPGLPGRDRCRDRPAGAPVRRTGARSRARRHRRAG